MEAIFSELKSLSSKLALVTLVGYEDGAGAKLIEEAAAEALNSRLVEEVEHGAPFTPGIEWDALRVFAWVADRQGEAFTPPDLTDLALARKVIHAAKSVGTSQTFGSRAVRTRDLLAWDTLVRVFGGEDVIKTAVARLREDEADDPVIDLAQRYLAGWRPSEFPTDD